MRRTAKACLGLGLLSALTCACEREPQGTSHKTTQAPAGSGQVLDGMQLDSARRVALETAVEAMKARNVDRLKQLRVWVRGRASVPVFSDEDLSTLDLAIACLEHVAPPASASAQLDGVKSSKLVQAARELCAAE